MSDGVSESRRFPPIDGLHDRCCNISNERCRTAPLEFIKSPFPRLRNLQVLFLLACYCVVTAYSSRTPDSQRLSISIYQT